MYVSELNSELNMRRGDGKDAEMFKFMKLSERLLVLPPIIHAA